MTRTPHPPSCSRAALFRRYAVAALSGLLLSLPPVEASRLWPGDFAGVAPPSPAPVPLLARDSPPVLRATLDVLTTTGREALAAATDTAGAVYAVRQNDGVAAFRPSSTPGGGALASAAWKQAWTVATPSTGIEFAPVLSPDATVLFYGGATTGLIAANVSTGEPLWSYKFVLGTTPYAPLHISFSADGSTAFVAARGPAWAGRCWCTDGNSFWSEIGTMHAIRVADGTRIWSYNTPWPCPPFGPYNNCGIPSNWPAQVGGQPLGAVLLSQTTLLVAITSLVYRGFTGNDPNQWPSPIAEGGKKGGLLALDAQTGALLWRAELADGATSPVYLAPPSSSPSSSSSSTVAFLASGAHVCAMAVAPVGPGGTIWRRTFTDTTVSHMVVGADGVVYAATSNVRLSAMSATDGSLLWSVPSFGAPFSPLLVHNGTLVAVTATRLFALDTSQKGAVLWSIDAPPVALFSGAVAFDASGSLVVPTTAGSYMLYARCSPGHFCPAPSSEIACPAGSFSAGDARACTLCAAGTHNMAVSAASSASGCIPCPPGTSSPEGSVTCERLVHVLGPEDAAMTCPLKLFPSADLAGYRLEALNVGTEADCAAVCCSLAGGVCAGFSFCRLSGVSPSCTLLGNVTHVVPSSIMSSGVRTSLLGP
jgi:outer membrane protein assembly factor BamB